MDWIKDDYAQPIITNLSDSDLADEAIALEYAFSEIVEDWLHACVIEILDEFRELVRDEIVKRFCGRHNSKVADNGKEE